MDYCIVLSAKYTLSTSCLYKMTILTIFFFFFFPLSLSFALSFARPSPPSSYVRPFSASSHTKFTAAATLEPVVHLALLSSQLTHTERIQVNFIRFSLSLSLHLLKPREVPLTMWAQRSLHQVQRQREIAVREDACDGQFTQEKEWEKSGRRMTERNERTPSLVSLRKAEREKCALSKVTWCNTLSITLLCVPVYFNWPRNPWPSSSSLSLSLLIIYYYHSRCAFLSRHLFLLSPQI